VEGNGGSQERGKGYIRGTERQWLGKAVPSALKTHPPASLHILMLALYVFDSTLGEMASSQEWESPGGAAAAAAASAPPRRHLCLCFVYCFVSVFAFVPVLALKMSVYD